MQKIYHVTKTYYVETCIVCSRTEIFTAVERHLAFGRLGFDLSKIDMRFKRRRVNSGVCEFVNARMSIDIVRATHLCLRGSPIPTNKCAIAFRSGRTKQVSDFPSLGPDKQHCPLPHTCQAPTLTSPRRHCQCLRSKTRNLFEPPQAQTGTRPRAIMCLLLATPYINSLFILENKYKKQPSTSGCQANKSYSKQLKILMPIVDSK